MKESLVVKSFNNFFMNSQNESTELLEFSPSYDEAGGNYKKILTNFTLNPFQKNKLRKFLYRVENIAPSQSCFQVYLIQDELGYIADIVIDSLYTNFKIYLIENDFETLIDKARIEIESQVNTWKGMRFLGREA